MDNVRLHAQLVLHSHSLLLTIINSSRQELLHVIAGDAYLSIESREIASWKRKYRMTDEIYTVSREFYLNNKPRIKIHNERLYLVRVYQQQHSVQNISFCSKLQCANSSLPPFFYRRDNIIMSVGFNIRENDIEENGHYTIWTHKIIIDSKRSITLSWNDLFLTIVCHFFHTLDNGSFNSVANCLAEKKNHRFVQSYN